MNIDQTQLAEAFAEHAFVTVCAGCHAITSVRRDVRHGISHGLCQRCADRLYPEYAGPALDRRVCPCGRVYLAAGEEEQRPCPACAAAGYRAAAGMVLEGEATLETRGRLP